MSLEGPQEADGPSPGDSGERAGLAREHGGHAASRGEQTGGEPDVVLDVPMLKVEELELEVEDLRAHVSLRAELADLVKVNVGVDVHLDKVRLGVKGVEAQALLKVRLDKVLDTLNRALEAIGRDPGILNRDTERAADDPSGEANRVVRRAVDEAGDITETVFDESGDVVAEEITGNLDDLRIEEEYVDAAGRIVSRARDESGGVVEEVLDEEGNVLEANVPGEEDQDASEVKATEAAKRKARELGVRLSGVEGTGSGGRVLVRDVEKATR